MADSTSLSILRQTPLSSSIATKEWTEDNFLSGGNTFWYGECSTAAGTAAKTVTIENFPPLSDLKNGDSVRIKFANAQTYNGAPTLNINETGASYIKSNGFTNAARYEWAAGEIIDFSWNVSAWTIVDGGKATTTYYGVTKLASTATTTSDTYAATPGAIFKVVGNTVYGIPNTWTKNTQYSVGDKVYNAGKYYECIEANSSATFDATKFREIDNAQTQIDNLSNAVANIDIPEVPTDLSAFTNSPGYLTAHQSLSDLYTLSGEVVEGLSNIVIPKLDTISGLVEDEVEKVDEISAKFDNYSLTGHTHTSSDITNFPPIPTVNNGTLTIQKNGQNVQTFTANQSTSVSANIIVPTKTSDLTNDSNFLTAHQSLSALSKYLPLSGGTLTGNLTIEKANPILTLQDNDSVRTPYVKINGLDHQIIAGNDSFTATLTLPRTSGTLALSSQIPTKTSDLTNDSGYVVSSDLTKVMEYQGSVETYENLPVSAKKGDVYNVISAHGDYPPGTNYAKGENGWDPLGGSIDVSKFAEVSALNKLSSETVNGLSVVVNPKLSTIAGKVEEEVAKLDELSGKLSAYTLTSDFNDLISTITDELSSNINPKLSTIADQVSAETQKVDEISARLDDFALTSDIPSDYLSGVKMNGSLRTVTNKVVDLGTVLTAHQSLTDYAKLSNTILSIQDEYTEWVVTPSYIMSVDEYSQDYLGKTIYLKWVEWEPGNPNASGWQPYVLAGSITDWCGGFIGNLSSTELVWEEFNWVGKGSLSAKRYKKSAVLGDQTSVDLALADHTHSLSDIANLPGVVQTGSYNDLLDKPTIPLSTSQLTNNSGYIKKTELQNDLSNYLPLSGGTLSGDFKVLTDDGKNCLSGLSSCTGLAIGDRSYAQSTTTGSSAQNAANFGQPPQAIAIGNQTKAQGNFAIAIGAAAEAKKTSAIAIGNYNTEALSVQSIAIGAGAESNNSYAIQLGKGANNEISSFQVFNWQLLDSNGNVPEARLSSVGYIKKETADERYVLKNEKTIMPIYGPWVGSPLLLSTNIELYQVLDMDGTGTFPVLSAPTDIASFGKCYYCFEIEWITNSAAASFSQQLDWINEPEIQSDGEWHTYYITGRYKSDNGEYTMNCWRVK